MRSSISRLLVAALSVAVCVGCASLQRAKEAHLLSDARQIASTRLRMIAEHPENAAPTLSEVVTSHALLDAERVAPFEITADWNNREADKEIVLRQKWPVAGRRVVACGNGIALVIKE